MLPHLVCKHMGKNLLDFHITPRTTYKNPCVIGDPLVKSAKQDVDDRDVIAGIVICYVWCRQRPLPAMLFDECRYVWCSSSSHGITPPVSCSHWTQCRILCAFGMGQFGNLLCTTYLPRAHFPRLNHRTIPTRSIIVNALLFSPFIVTIWTQIKLSELKV